MSEKKLYTRAEVAQYKGKNNSPVWVIYKDSVYDVTKYITEHPGGDVILEEAGKDCTKTFNDVGHTSDALTVMKKYKIGELVEEEKHYDENGKKKKKKVVAQPLSDKPAGRSCINIVTCGLVG